MERALSLFPYRVLRLAGAGLVLLGVAACARSAAPPTPLPAAAAPRFRAIALQPGDSLTIDDATNEVVFDITSEKGIGRIEFERLGAPPETMTMNLRLKGLEEFRFTWDDVRVTGRVSSQDGTVRQEMSAAGGQPVQIDETSPYWMPVRIEAENPQVPLSDGYFAIGAPQAFLEDAPERFTLQWIDFYR